MKNKNIFITKRLVATVLTSLLAVTACSKNEKDQPVQEPIKKIVEASKESRLPAAVEPIWLEQGWTKDEALDFYNTSQGSQLMPYSWFLALEQVSSTELFRDTKNIRKLGYIPQQKLKVINPDGLPIGFVKDEDLSSLMSNALSNARTHSDSEAEQTEYKEWLGFNCAACHTSEIIHEGTSFIIDGGPPGADFQLLIQGLSAALNATTDNPDKLTRFAKRVLSDGGYNEIEETRLKNEVEAYKKWIDDYIQINYAGLTSPYGYGRLDAFGAILNRVSSSFLEIPTNATPSNAPVSYPFLWNSSQMSWVQWNGSANNHIGRNVGEVSGVFAHTIIKTDKPEEKFSSSAKVVNLDRLEQLMSTLDSPKWQSPLPAIDEVNAKAGQQLYSDNCEMCHSVRDEKGQFPMTKPNPIGMSFIDIKMVALDKIGTDPLMATNFVNPQYNADPGVIRDLLPEEYKNLPKVPRAAILTAIVGEVIKKQLSEFSPALDQEQLLELAGGHLPADKGGSSPPNLLAYKARPLNGIWATAPYLHSGTVANLYDLLLPDTNRPKSIEVGGRTLDTKNVGFISTETSNTFTLNTLDAEGKPLAGNSNLGHSGQYYTSRKNLAGEWVDYTDVERYQLIEYIKTL